VSHALLLKGDTAAIILDGVKIVQKKSIENKTEQQNKYRNSIIVTNFHLFYKNNAVRMTLLLLCNLCLPCRLTWSSFSTFKTAKVAIADGQTFPDSIDKKSAGNLNLVQF
jgi:hypothetical protein